MAKVVWKTDGGVLSVLLNRPDKRNALDGEMIAELQAAFTAPPAAEERVAVIRAAGPVFCAGLDMKERAAQLASGMAATHRKFAQEEQQSLAWRKMQVIRAEEDEAIAEAIRRI